VNYKASETEQFAPELLGELRRPSASLLELLKAYQRVRDAADNLPPVVMVRTRHQAPEVLSRFRSLPRPQWFLRFFIDFHVDQVLAALNRRYSERAALTQTSQFDEFDRRAVEEFRRSIPPLSARIRGYSIALFLLVLALAKLVLRWLETFAGGAGGESQIHTGSPGVLGSLHPDPSRDLLDKIGVGLTSPTPDAVHEVSNALVAAGPKGALMAALAMALAVYAVLRPLTPAFRLKRMFFNLYPSVAQYRDVTTARWHVSHSTGVYELERVHFRALGISPEREFPFDLLLPALFMLYPLVMGVLILQLTFVEHDLALLAFEVVFGLLLLAAVAVRFGWLLRTWRRRCTRGRVPYVPFEVQLKNSRAIARVQSPSSVGLLSLLSYILLGLSGVLALAPWWYRINRELRDLGSAHGVKLGRSPSMSAVALLGGFFYGIPAMPTVYRTCRRIQIAQRITGQPERLKPPWILMLGVLCPPLLFTRVSQFSLVMLS
jgi:hypothetical protein